MRYRSPSGAGDVGLCNRYRTSCCSSVLKPRLMVVRGHFGRKTRPVSIASMLYKRFYKASNWLSVYPSFTARTQYTHIEGSSVSFKRQYRQGCLRFIQNKQTHDSNPDEKLGQTINQDRFKIIN